jgi:hypothetical protein
MAEKSLKVLILLILMTLFGSCSGLKKCGEAGSGANAIHFAGAPLKGDFTRVLYKANMEAFGKQFSGIFLIKPEPADSSFRVVLLSEFGLNLMDMSVGKSGTTINNCQDFLKRRVIINSIEKNVRMLVFVPECMKDSKKYTDLKTNDIVYKARQGLTKYLYFYRREGWPYRIEQRRCFGEKLILHLDYDSTHMPSSITFYGRPVKHTMKLSILNIEK